MNGSGHNCSVQSEAVEYSLVALLIFEILLGLLGNAVALWTFCFQVKIWKPYTVYLFNLVIADVLLMVFLPFRIIFFLQKRQWVFGEGFCRATLFFLVLNRVGSITFLTAVAAERYFRVLHPYSKIKLISSQTAKGISCLIWLLVTASTVPILTTSKVRGHHNECRGFVLRESPSSVDVWQDLVFFAEFLIPFGLIMFCTISIVRKLRDRNLVKQPRVQKAVALLVVVAVVFVICFMPSIIARAAVLLLPTSASCADFSVKVNVFDVALCLTYLNSAMDPIVYCFSSSTFRCSYRRALNSMRRKELAPETCDLSKDSDG